MLAEIIGRWLRLEPRRRRSTASPWWTKTVSSLGWPPATRWPLGRAEARGGSPRDFEVDLGVLRVPVPPDGSSPVFINRGVGTPPY